MVSNRNGNLTLASNLQPTQGASLDRDRRFEIVVPAPSVGVVVGEVVALHHPRLDAQPGQPAAKLRERARVVSIYEQQTIGWFASQDGDIGVVFATEEGFNLLRVCRVPWYCFQ